MGYPFGVGAVQEGSLFYYNGRNALNDTGVNFVHFLLDRSTKYDELSIQHRLEERTPKHFKRRASRQPEHLRSVSGLFRVSGLRENSPHPSHCDFRSLSVPLAWRVPR